MKTFRILILEDDLKTLNVLVREIYQLEEELMVEDGRDISIVIMSEYTQVEKFLANVSSDDFDLVLLDRDCKAAGSFHVFDIEGFGPEKIISISSTPQWNEEAKQRGVTEVVYKDYQDLVGFGIKVIERVRERFL